MIGEQDTVALAENERVSASGAERRPRRYGPAWYAPLLGLGAIGLGAGLSSLFYSYYDLGVWDTLGLIVVVCAAAITVARPPRFTLPAGLAFGGLAGLGLWSLLSTGWGHAVEQGTIDANLWLAYAALLLLVVTLLRDRRHATVLLAAVGMGIAVVAGTAIGRMLGSDPNTLFLGGRLNAPLGYINGEGCVFAMGCWLGLALAERREPVLAGVGAAATVAMACLALLSQSRGAAIASLVAVVVALAAVPGVRRRLLAISFIAGGFAAASGAVLNVYSVGNAAGVPASVAHHAALAIIAAAAATGVAWGLAVSLTAAVSRRNDQSSRLLGRLATVLAVLVVAVPLAVIVVRAPSMERAVTSQWHAFVHLNSSVSPSPNATQTRLFSGGGTRYDYWRVAWHTFTAHPVAGVGAGNYAAEYYLHRRSQEAIQNPHSVELQMLSELGVVGAALLAIAVIGTVLGARRLRLAAQSSPAARSLMVAATGVTVVWLVETSGDWMHLLPGVSATALAAVAVLCCAGGTDYTAVGDAAGSPRRAERPRLGAPRPRRWLLLSWAASIAIVLAITGASLLRADVARRYLDDARGELASNPSAALTDAGHSLNYDGANLDAYYVKAAAQARFNDAAAARSTLLVAAHEDTQSFVTWALLGDLEVRRHNFGAARAFYKRANALDPNDPALTSLVTNPQAALSDLGGSGLRQHQLYPARR